MTGFGRRRRNHEEISRVQQRGFGWLFRIGERRCRLGEGPPGPGLQRICREELTVGWPASVWPDYLSTHGQLLAYTDGDEERSGGGRTDEQSAQSCLLKNSEECPLEQHAACEQRPPAGRPQDEEGIRQ